MTRLSEETLNGFARAIGTRFAEAAQGFDRTSAVFIGRRPHERILAGFLTPRGSAEDHLDEESEDGLPVIERDESYEQSNIGFEWSVPKSAIGRGGVINVEVGALVFSRVFPTFEEARENTTPDRHGQAKLVEVWLRQRLAGGEVPSLVAALPIDEAVERGGVLRDLTEQVGTAWRNLDSPDREAFDLRSEPRLTAGDVATADAYRHWVAETKRDAPREAPWRLQVDLRAFPSPSRPDAVRFLLRLVNMSRRVDRRRAAFVDPRVYGISFTAKLPGYAHQSGEFRVLPSSYRYDRSIQAVGINCQPRLSREQDAVVLSAHAVPVTEVPRLVPRQVSEAAPTFESLSDPERGPVVLQAIADAMNAYDQSTWQEKVDRLVDPEERKEAAETRALYREEIRAFQEGVALLRREHDGPAGQAFRMMNQAMLRAGQQRHVPITQWHAFQLVFIVSQLPAVVDSRGTSSGGNGDVGILWFPAGGGKTEAFLGLITWAGFFDRLSGKRLGVTAFLRYPLRLLTYQQLQRISWVLGQAEEVRIAFDVPGEPFTLGYYVGQSTTPNRISAKEHDQLRKDGVPLDWQRVFRCPSCGSRTVALRYNEDVRLVEHYCQDSTCRTRGGRLPIYVVDDDLYRYLPTVVVSTVDKLAQMGHNRRFSQLFGRIDLFCPVHGAAFKGSNRALCDASAELARGGRLEECRGARVVYGPFPHAAPTLHVQDEMHLMRESLATFDSHYETAAVAIQRSLDSRSTGWHLIGATATIAGYKEQSHHLYLRGATRFPAPGPAAYDSFYYTAGDGLLGRLYVGLLGVGRSHTPAVARALALLFYVVDGTRRGAARNLDAAREYLGLPDVTLDEIEELCFLYEVVLTYVLTRKGGDQVGEAIDTRVRPDVAAAVGSTLRVESFNSSVEMPRMISTMEEIESESREMPTDERIRGVVATNIISHGVDVDRFNVMVFAGLPRQYAEYIQASARVGRHVPGLSLLVITPQADRDRSVYDRFDKFHQYLDRLVEPVPVNRWSEPALELTIRGVLGAYIMGVAAADVGEELYFVRHVRQNFGRPGWQALDEDAVVDWVVRAVGAQDPSAPPDFEQVVRRMAARTYGQLTGAAEEYDDENINMFLKAMRSLRDVDEPAEIRLRSARDADLIRAMSL